MRLRLFLARVPWVFRTVVRNRELRRVELAFLAFNSAEWSVWLAMLVYAYERGGATASGIVAVVQLIPAMLFAPLASVLGDRYRAGRVLAAGYAAQALGMAATAVALAAAAPAPLVYALGAVAATAVTITRPTQSALIPSLARTPEELTGANVFSGWIASLSMLLAPALTGALLTVSGPATVFAVMAAAVTVALLLVLPVPGPPPAGEGDAETASVRAESAMAFRTLRQEPAARTLFLLLTVEFIAWGALDVLYPELAIGVLGKSSGWAGYLNAAFGLGATLGVVVTAGLVGARRLAFPLAAGLILWCVAMVVIGAVPTAAFALSFLAVAGVGQAVVDVSARTLLQRIAPSDVLARIFGLVEGVEMAGLAVGSLLVPLLIAVGGARLAFIGVGLLLPLGVALGGRRLLTIDRSATVPVVEIGLLRSLPIFAPLSAGTLESLARALVPIDAATDQVIVAEGDEGDRFFVIGDGSVAVTRQGHELATLARGEGFGEIALLHDVTRTATCTAITPTRLYALGKDEFLEAVTGHPRSAERVHELADARYTALQAAGRRADYNDEDVPRDR